MEGLCNIGMPCQANEECMYEICDGFEQISETEIIPGVCVDN